MKRPSVIILLVASLLLATGCPPEPDPEEGLPPVITLEGGNIRQVELGESVTLSPGFENLTPSAIIRWLRNGSVLAHGKTFTFTPEQVGVYYVTVVVTTEFGTAFKEIRIEVWKAEPVPPTPPDTIPAPPVERLRCVFEQTEYHVTEGRAIRLLPLDLDSTKHYTFTWSVDGTTLQEGEQALYRFEARSQGRFQVGFRMSDGEESADTTLTVVVCPPEGTYRRPADANSSPRLTRVHSFLPAPGQYVNENYTARTMEEACTYAKTRLDEGNYVSLGGFGGSLVVGFDHSIESDGDYNLAVKNTLYTNYSEPGIVWVMQDENGDGLPNDTWYELKGSEYGLECTVQDYAVTYYRPEAPASKVHWTDNRGGSGKIDYLAAYHKQDYYYPLWVQEDSYILRGTRLEARNYDQSGTGTYWINPDYGWGYADNFSPVDMIPERATGLTAGCNHFRISDAVTYDGQPANLQYIDFVKVQTGLNAKSGWLGELSTEVMDVIDFNLVK